MYFVLSQYFCALFSISRQGPIHFPLAGIFSDPGEWNDFGWGPDELKSHPFSVHFSD